MSSGRSLEKVCLTPCPPSVFVAWCGTVVTPGWRLLLILIGTDTYDISRVKILNDMHVRTKMKNTLSILCVMMLKPTSLTREKNRW